VARSQNESMAGTVGRARATFAVPLFVVDRFAPFFLGEQVLFTLWPSNLILMVDDSWSLFLIVMPISMAFNAAIYAGWSVIIWVVCRAVSRRSA
jgi:hypothetical protein